ncbi:MAG TPA: prolyl oligopeptidase family serine peptidase [Candidatus Limnocylindria bacterium]|nr:prolyl oligopeptidase family serine peptidase [Candidatus Limnocylindria bacterium]
MKVVTTIMAAAGLLLAATPSQAQIDPARCHAAAGKRGAACFAAYTKAVDKCRKKQDPACEAGLRAEGGLLAELLADNDAPIAAACDDAAAQALDYLGVADVQKRIDEGCMDWAEDALALEWSADLGSLGGAFLRCQRNVATTLDKLRRKTVALFGRGCFGKIAKGRACNRERRDARFARAQAAAAKRIEKACKQRFGALGLGSLDALVADTAERARHFAILVYPPNDLGPTGTFGPYRIGVTTLALSDATRNNVAGDGPRPVVTEVYYPTTDAAVAGVPREVVRVLGVPITEVPAYRDVPRAEGQFPLVVFSHGNNGIRIQSLFFYGHLASHGYIVATPDHHGNTFVDTLAGTIDPLSFDNRPRDMSFVIDRLLADGGPFAAAIDPEKIGASGHSFGGYTTFALATQAAVGPPPDPRVRAIFPQAPSALGFTDEAFGALTIPTLIVGGSIDGTTPFASEQQRPFDLLPSGATVVGLARIEGGGHFTFSNFCDVDRALLGFLGGFEEACLPKHLPWRHAHEIVNYLALAFFDGVLRGDAAALARLEEAAGGTIDDLHLTLK